MRQQVDVPAATLADIEHSIQALRNAGAPDDATIRIRVRASFNADGGTAKTLTASWTTPN